MPFDGPRRILPGTCPQRNGVHCADEIATDPRWQAHFWANGRLVRDCKWR